MSSARLDELILAETREVKKRQRQRRSGLRSGPGRPDFAELGGARPGTSPLPAIGRSASAVQLGSSKGHGGRGGPMSQSMTALPSSNGEGGDDGDDDVNKYTGKVETLQLEVTELRAQYNSLRDTHRRLRTNISDFSHKLNYLKREDDVEENRRNGMEQIEKQRFELEKAKKMLEDTLNYRRTLQYMTTRLKDERLTYDNTLKAYEEALEVRRAEGAEVRALAAEVRMAKTQEERELTRLKQLTAKERIYWKEQVEERRREAKKREEQKRWAEERKRKEEEEDDEDTGKDEGKQGPSSTKLHIISTNKLDLNALRAKVDEYQRAFTEIRLATGLNSVDDMVERYNQHTAHTEEMDRQIVEIRTEVERLTERRMEMQRKLETIKFSGAGSTDFNHDMIDKLSREGDEARRKLKIIREEHEKVEKMNLEVKQSIDAMARKLKSVIIETPNDNNTSAKAKEMAEKESKMNVIGGDDGVGATIKLIGRIEEKMTQLMEALDAGGDGGGGRNDSGSSSEGGTGAVGDLQNIMETLLSKNKFNVRVRPSTPTSKEHLLLKGAGLSASANRPNTGTRADIPAPKQKGGKDNADAGRRRGAGVVSES
jgi:hypothetical protein